MKWRELAVDPLFNLECYLDLQEKRIERLKEENKRLNSNKDKAIEYIDEHTLFVNGGIIKSILKESCNNEE